MKPDLNNALDNVEMTYNELVTIANDMLADIFKPINNLIDVIGEDINNLTANQLKDYMWKLQYKAYALSDVKDKSAMKAEISETLRKEKYAIKFGEAQGSAAVKDNVALIESSEEIIIESLYNLISNLTKTKLDQIHRLVAVISSILIARMQEAKMSITNGE